LYIAGKLQAYKARRAAEISAAQDPVLVFRAGVERAALAAVRRYTPGHFAGRVCLIVPCENWARTLEEPLRWRSVAGRSEAYFGPDGCNTDNMLLEPYAPAFAELFRGAVHGRADSRVATREWGPAPFLPDFQS
jgi:hypothetical protein